MWITFIHAGIQNHIEFWRYYIGSNLIYVIHNIKFYTKEKKIHNILINIKIIIDVFD